MVVDGDPEAIDELVAGHEQDGNHDHDSRNQRRSEALRGGSRWAVCWQLAYTDSRLHLVVSDTAWAHGGHCYTQFRAGWSPGIATLPAHMKDGYP